jgi:hypothetical protein
MGTGTEEKEIATAPRGIKWFAVGVSLMVAASVVTGLFVSGSPGAERARRLDEQRLNDLRSLSYTIDAFWHQYDRLPESLDEIDRLHQPKDFNKDPRTGEAYEYLPIDEQRYELCAAFDQPSDDEYPTYGRYAEPVPIRVPEPDYSQPKMRSWEHPAGRHCFQLEVPVVEERLID